MPANPSICIVSHDGYGAISGGHSGHIGGVEWQTTLTARWLVEHGYPVTMLTWDEGGPLEEAFDGVRVRKICRQRAGLSGLRFFHPKWTSLVRALCRADADVYYQNGGECVTGQIAGWCHRRRKTFVFSAASDADCNPRLPELKTRRERLLYRYGLQHADHVIVQTRVQQGNLRRSFGVESTVIPMPCPGPAHGESMSPQTPNPRVLWIGRICQVKRPDRYLDLAEKAPHIFFDLVGPLYDDSLGAVIRERARRIPNLDAHGAIPREQMPEFYRRAALLCCTSEYEGFPNTFLEAWSHGLPVVSMIDPDGLIARRRLGLVVKGVSEMRRGIQKLLESPDMYRELSDNVRSYYQENHTVDRILPLFEKVFVDAWHRMTPPTHQSGSHNMIAEFK